MGNTKLMDILMMKEIIKGTDGHFNSLSLIIKSKRVPQTEETGGQGNI